MKSKARKKKIKVTAKDGSIIELTPAQKMYADLKGEQPQASLATIARQAYPNAKPDTVRQIVNANEKNKAIAMYSDEQVVTAKNYIAGVVSDPEVKTRDRLTASFDILDRNIGKAIQRTEVQSTALNINIDLSGIAEEEVDVAQ